MLRRACLRAQGIKSPAARKGLELALVSALKDLERQRLKLQAEAQQQVSVTSSG